MILRQGRILALASFNEDNESQLINNFNKEYETELMVPIVYDPTEDTLLINRGLKSSLIFQPYR